MLCDPGRAGDTAAPPLPQIPDAHAVIVASCCKDGAPWMEVDRKHLTTHDHPLSQIEISFADGLLAMCCKRHNGLATSQVPNLEQSGLDDGMRSPEDLRIFTRTTPPRSLVATREPSGCTEQP